MYRVLPQLEGQFPGSITAKVDYIEFSLRFDKKLALVAHQQKIDEITFIFKRSRQIQCNPLATTKLQTGEQKCDSICFFHNVNTAKEALA